ncbi:hypothetical protein BVX97_02665 [bacterium E08(2017)]|nr:hypothetical protein BVX97_02665 [bacterium E08(2017)]
MHNKRLKIARIKKSMTQLGLAEMVGVKEYDVTRWETGRATPERRIQEQIASILEVKRWEVFDS